MTSSPAPDRDAFEADFIYGPRRRERFAWFVAAAGMLVGVAGMVAGASLIPLKTTETFVVVVDKETGEMDRVAAVQALDHAPTVAREQLGVLHTADFEYLHRQAQLTQHVGEGVEEEAAQPPVGDQQHADRRRGAHAASSRWRSCSSGKTPRSLSASCVAM